MSEIKDFTRERKRLHFRIDGDDFEAASAIPAEIYVEFVTRYEGLDDTESIQGQLQHLVSALELVLLPESFALFYERLKDRARPIDIDQAADVVLWLMEEYGMRPTQPSEPSSDGPASPESGTSSTESTQPEESTSPTSELIAS